MSRPRKQIPKIIFKMQNKSRAFIIGLLISGITILFSPGFANAQDAAKDTQPIGVGAAPATKQSSGKVLQDITLGAVQIKYRVQMPRVKFAMEKVPMDVVVDREKLESLSNSVDREPGQVLFRNKKTEEPMDYKPSRVYDHTVSGD